MDKESLSNKVYITRKSRICASERLKYTEVFIQGINIYYSIFVSALAIYSIYCGTTKLSLMITILSVIVTITIVYLASQKYGERAKSLKNNYVALEGLNARIEQSSSDKELKKLHNEYCKLLYTYENHSEYDYYKAKLAIEKSIKRKKTDTDSNDNFLTCKQKVIFHTKYMGSVILKFILIVIPLLLMYVAVCFKWLT